MDDIPFRIEKRQNSGAVRETTPDEFVNCALALMADTLLDAQKFHKVVLLVTTNKS